MTITDAGVPSGAVATKRVSPHVWASASSRSWRLMPRSSSARRTEPRVGVAFGVPTMRLNTADVAQPRPSAPMIDASGPIAARIPPATAAPAIIHTNRRAGRTR